MPVMDACATARRWAAFYRSKGFQPLPSRTDEKRPLIKFGHLWEDRIPDQQFADLLESFPTTNWQVMTGRHWGLCVIDCDGPEAVDRWTTLGPYYPHTWEVESPGGGRHIWYRTRPIMTDAMAAKGLFWGVWDESLRDGRGDWRKRCAIEWLCDRSLIVAPPSIHPNTGKPYRFRAGRSPRNLTRPAMLPEWVLNLPRLQAPRTADAAPAAPPPKVAPPPEGGRDLEALMAAIPDKVAVARSFGLRFSPRTERSGNWVSVHDFNREDADPSARFDVARGRFWRPGELTMSLFQLGVELGVYRDWRECYDALAAVHLPRR